MTELFPQVSTTSHVAVMVSVQEDPGHAVGQTALVSVRVTEAVRRSTWGSTARLRDVPAKSAHRIKSSNATTKEFVERAVPAKFVFVQCRMV